MTQEKIQKTKDFFLENIPEKLLNALNDYDAFTMQPAPNDFKSFGAYHSACKSALSHILLLMKLLQAVGSNEDSNPADDWLKKAQQAVLQLEEDDEK